MQKHVGINCLFLPSQASKGSWCSPAVCSFSWGGWGGFKLCHRLVRTGGSSAADFGGDGIWRLSSVRPLFSVGK